MATGQERLAASFGEVVKQVADAAERFSTVVSEAAVEFELRLRDILDEHKFLSAGSWAASDAPDDHARRVEIFVSNFLVGVDPSRDDGLFIRDAVERLTCTCAVGPRADRDLHAPSCPVKLHDDRASHKFPVVDLSPAVAERPLSFDVARNVSPGTVSVTDVEGQLQAP